MAPLTEEQVKRIAKDVVKEALEPRDRGGVARAAGGAFAGVDAALSAAALDERPADVGGAVTAQALAVVQRAAAPRSQRLMEPKPASRSQRSHPETGR